MEVESLMEKLKDFFNNNDRFAALAGIELLEIKEGTALAKMEVRDIHFNAGNIVQGGVLFSLADITFAAAVSSFGKLIVSVETSIRFFKSTSQGTLYAEASIIDLHRTIATCEVRITDQETNLIALFTATAYRKDIPLPVD